jgi:GTP-binding protein HflX
VTEEVLGEIGAGDVAALVVMNKADLLPRGRRPAAARDAVWVSARTGTGLPALLARIEQALDAGLARVRCELPSDRGDVVAWLRRSGRVVEEYYRDGVVTVTALVPPKVAGQLHKEFPGITRGE